MLYFCNIWHHQAPKTCHFCQKINQHFSSLTHTSSLTPSRAQKKLARFVRLNEAIIVRPSNPTDNLNQNTSPHRNSHKKSQDISRASLVVSGESVEIIKKFTYRKRGEETEFMFFLMNPTREWDGKCIFWSSLTHSVWWAWMTLQISRRFYDALISIHGYLWKTSMGHALAWA